VRVHDVLRWRCQVTAQIPCMSSRAARVKFIQAVSAAERLRQPDPHDWLKEQGMADDKTVVGGQDSKRINLSEDYEVMDWAKSLGVSEEELRKAVAMVGDDAAAVREHLGKK